MIRAASRPATKPAQHAISHTFLKTRSVVSNSGKLNVGPDIENAYFKRRVRFRFEEKPRQRLRFSRIESAAKCPPTRSFDFGNQRHELFPASTAGKYGETLSGEFPRNCRADEIASADHGYGSIANVYHSSL